MNNIFLFLASFLLVFLLGIQQLNVEHRKYRLAMVTSVCIAAANYLLFKLLPAGGFDVVQFIWFALGGAIGISSSMWVHDTLMTKM